MTATKSLSYLFTTPVPPAAASTTTSISVKKKMTTTEEEDHQQRQEEGGGGGSDQQQRHLQLPRGFRNSSIILQTDPLAGSSMRISQTDPLAGSAIPGGFRNSSSILQTDPLAGSSMRISQTDPLAGSATRISSQPTLPERRPSRQASTGLVQVNRVSSIGRHNGDDFQLQQQAMAVSSAMATTRGISPAPVPHDIDSDDEMQPKRSPSGFKPSLRVNEHLKKQLSSPPVAEPAASAAAEAAALSSPQATGPSLPSLRVNEHLRKQLSSPPIEAASAAAEAAALSSPSGATGPSLVAESNTRSMVSPKQTRKSKKSSTNKDGTKTLKSPKQKSPKRVKKKMAAVDLDVPLLASPGGNGGGDEAAAAVNSSTTMKSPKRKSKKPAASKFNDSDGHHPTKLKKSINKKKDGSSLNGTSPKSPKRKLKKKVTLDPEKIEAKLTKVEAIMSKMVRKQGEEAFASERFAVLLERQEKYQRQLKKATKNNNGDSDAGEVRRPSKAFSNVLQRYRKSQSQAQDQAAASSERQPSERESRDDNNRRSLGIEKMKSYRPPDKRMSFEAPPPLTHGPQALKSMRSLVSVASKRSIRTIQPKRSDKVSAPRLKELETIYRPKVFDKTPEDIVIIKKVLARNFVFKKVKDLAAEQLLRAFEPITTYQKGDVIINQGDVGNYFYILGPYGSVAFEDSSSESGSGEQHKQKEANIPGTAFGVLAVLYRNPSRVTVRVSSEESRIYRVDQVTFRYILQSRSKAKTLAMQAVTKVKAVNRLLGLLDTVATERRLKSRHLSLVIDTDDEDNDEDKVAEEEEEAKKQIEEAQHDVELKEKEDYEQVQEEPKSDVVEGEEQKKDLIVGEEEQQQVEQEGMPRFEVFVPKEVFEGSGRTSPSDPVDEEAQDDISLALDEISASGLDDYMQSFADLEYSKYMEELNTSRFSLRKTMVKGSGNKTMDIDMFQKMTVLGEGQFGEVWLVQPNVEEISDTMFALKIQSKEDMSAHSAEYSVEEAIRRECRVLDKVCHPFIVDFVHSFDDRDNIYLIMSLIRGVELWNCIHREQDDGHWVSGLQEDHSKFYAILIADTLNFMHRQNICHRDIKPENVMIDHAGYPILVDFGFAKELPDDGTTYTMCGTPKYTAPEVIANEGHGCPVDHWALGVVIYEMLSGENPFWYEDISDIQLLEDICTAEPYPIEDDEAECSDLAIDIICKLLQKDPEKRLLGNDVTSHPWFNSIDLNKARRMELPAPWAPACSDGLMPNSPAIFGKQN